MIQNSKYVYNLKYRCFLWVDLSICLYICVLLLLLQRSMIEYHLILAKWNIDRISAFVCACAKFRSISLRNIWTYYIYISPDYDPNFGLNKHVAIFKNILFIYLFIDSIKICVISISIGSANIIYKNCIDTFDWWPVDVHTTINQWFLAISEATIIKKNNNWVWNQFDTIPEHKAIPEMQ